jgi:dephospho-CoA kinase
MATTVVALCGRMRSGKDTCGDALCSLLGFQRRRFAAPLKASCMTAFAFTPEQVEGNSKDDPDPRYGVTPRDLMQWLGTEVFQYQLQHVIPGVGRSFWAERLVREIQREAPQRVVVTDLRFAHEAASLRASFPKCLILRVVRPSKGRRAGETHASESESDEVVVDDVIRNDGDVAKLHAALLHKVCAFVK